jgi:GTP-binding protein HflX
MRAVVVVPLLPAPRGDDDRSRPRLARSAEARLEEAVGLAAAIDLDITYSAAVAVNEPRPATLFGSGKVEELAEAIRDTEAGLLIVDHPLTPVQQRNLEKETGAKVLDRTGLILEIFGRRARTKEGTLQVDLAHLTYQKGRLVRSWTHLERQRGGAGFLGGPGETQIEADRRALQDKIIRLKRELEQVRRTRDLHRAKRRKVPFPVVAIVGYTNAGKSTLFNRLTGAGVLAEDMLFATLDPTLRRVRLPHGTPVILSDTVGFISDLPTHLVAAFRATLEEVVEADLVLHLRDIADPDTAAQADDVERILADLGVDASDTRPGDRGLEQDRPAGRAEPAAAARRGGRRDPSGRADLGGDGRGDRQADHASSSSGSSGELAIHRRSRCSRAELGLVDWLYRNGDVVARKRQRRRQRHDRRCKATASARAEIAPSRLNKRWRALGVPRPREAGENVRCTRTGGVLKIGRSILPQRGQSLLRTAFACCQSAPPSPPASPLPQAVRPRRAQRLLDDSGSVCGTCRWCRPAPPPNRS